MNQQKQIMYIFPPNLLSALYYYSTQYFKTYVEVKSVCYRLGLVLINVSYVLPLTTVITYCIELTCGARQRTQEVCPSHHYTHVALVSLQVAIYNTRNKITLPGRRMSIRLMNMYFPFGTIKHITY